MGSFKDNTYVSVVPEDIDKTQEEWEELSYHTQYYYVKDGRKEQIRNKEKERIKRKTEWVNSIKSEQGCSNCDEKEPVCLDFHHLKDKETSVSEMVVNDFNRERIKNEIEKCIILCANCHRKEHRKV